MSGRLGEHRPFPPAVRARIYRQFVASLAQRYPSYRGYAQRWRQQQNWTTK